MPKFVGATIPGARHLGNNKREHGTQRVRLTYSQAVLLPAEQIECSLDTTDSGSKGSYAKRWYRWFASAAAILACEASTPKMIAAADKARKAAGPAEGVAIDAEMSGDHATAERIRASAAPEAQ